MMVVTITKIISYNVHKVQSGAPEGRYGKLFFIRNAYNYDKSQQSTCMLAKSYIMYLKGPNNVIKNDYILKI